MGGILKSEMPIGVSECFVFQKCPAICRGEIPLNSFALHFGFQKYLVVCM